MKRLKLALCFLFILGLCLGSVACGEPEPATDTKGTQPSSDVASTEENIPDPPKPVLYENPLTGLMAEANNVGARPVAIMLNNIKQALPQEGISDVDILLECLVEGGITRLMGIVSDCKSLEEIGSIRSSRPYYLDFAQAFDAIYCHAGGSTEAYNQIASRRINNVDGVKKDPLDVYYRDPQRLETMALEHTMMTTGEGIAKSIEHFKYRTTLREDFESPISFPAADTSVPVGTDDALHVYIPVSSYQKVDYVYDAEAKEYLRYQHDGNKHVDGNNGEQLSFKNIIVLFCATRTMEEKLLNITTTGTGTGYLISEGKYTTITWSRTDRDGNLTLTDTSGEPLVLNRGKTAINVCPKTVEKNVNMNAVDRAMKP
ncbi:MAG: DUF3048 domain-containing protein [Clostridia bacterium]|nr:DUF3048 domain-containing protein [Clostridia bacterium]